MSQHPTISALKHRFPICLFFASLFTSSPTANANWLAPPTGPAISPTGTYTIYYEYTEETYNCTATYLEEKPAGASGWLSITDSNGDGAVTFVNRPPGIYEYRTHLECEYAAGEDDIVYDRISDSIFVQVGQTPTPDPMDVQETYNFVVKRGDINSDGRTDFFVQRTSGGDPHNGVIDKLFLIQAVDGSFASDLRTTADRNVASSWSIATTDIKLLDINLDGSVDLIIRGLQSGVAPQIVFSSGQVFEQQSPGILAIDAKLVKLVGELRSFYLDQDYYLDNAEWVPGYSYDEWQEECEFIWWYQSPEWICTWHLETVYVPGYWSYESFESEGVAIAKAIEEIVNNQNGSFEDIIEIFEQIIKVIIGNVTGIGCSPRPDDHDGQGTCVSEIVSQLFVRLINALEEDEYHGRPPGTFRVTGRLIDWHSGITTGWENPRYHTALEYSLPEDGETVWYSGLPDYWPLPWTLVGHRNAVNDEPRNMITLGTVIPPFSKQFTYDQLESANANYCDCLEYSPSPTFPVVRPDKYNSNGYVNGLIQYINALFVPMPDAPDPSGNYPSIAPGWDKFVPGSYFD